LQYLFIHLFIYLFIYLLIYLFIYLFIYLRNYFIIAHAYRNISIAFSGLYYDRDQTNPLEYKLVTRKTAIVPAVSIVYICSEMNANNDIQDTGVT
jgi:hypothetical protein